MFEALRDQVDMSSVPGTDVPGTVVVCPDPNRSHAFSSTRIDGQASEQVRVGPQHE